jgi:hypothetical protein
MDQDTNKKSDTDNDDNDKQTEQEEESFFGNPTSSEGATIFPGTLPDNLSHWITSTMSENKILLESVAAKRKAYQSIAE